TKQKAAKAMWYKFKNGKQKIENKKKKIEKIFKENPGLEKFIDDLYEINVKEIAMGEYSSKDIIKAINDKFNIDFSEIYLI
ncbi:MAG TPA: hypothetical protein VMZ91_01275, partial [Candidatus Paceibacterota bacterium]|nr:hypothetical protein [Candidatus Paceibacterota bacterium]